jgi:hypothetical protein
MPCVGTWPLLFLGELAPSRLGERGFRRMLAAALIAGLLLTTLASSRAFGAHADVAATRAYIQANYRLVRAAVSQTRPIEASLQGVLGNIRAQCPLAAAGSPQDANSEQLSNEVIGEMVLTAGRPLRGAGRAFVAAAAHLSWSDRSLTRAIRAYVGKVATLTVLQPPSLCSDVQSWAAGGFHALPASTVAFAPRFMAAWVAPGELPASLAPYESPADHRLAGRTARLEERFSELEAREVETWGHIMSTLALWP